LPFEKLVDELQPTRSLSHSPLFQVMFVLLHAADGAAAPGGLRLRPLPSTSNTAKFDLTLFVVAHAGGLSGSLEYNTDLFDRPTIGRLAEHLKNLLAAMVATPAAALAKLPLLSAAERHQLLAEWSAPSVTVLRQLAQEYERRGAALPPLVDPEIHLLDRHLEPVPIGVPGELFLGGHRTGDRVRRLADGRLDFLVDRGALPAPAGAGPGAERIFVAPQTAVEEVMAGLFSEVLGAERIGVTDNFFALGGHSLLATRLMMKLRAVFGVEVPLRALFEGPTIAGLSTAFALAAGGTELLEEIAEVYQEAAAFSEEEIAELLAREEPPG
ncbi:MAG TPA: condensation domain-containing protein, partial [Thermoanaerobaculia bacterium]|nr:condensation domain-containing protein [Thermoanaerobaculia bacterium]